MIKSVDFAKLAGKWYVLLPEYEGDIEDLQMVCGADLMLDALTHNGSQAKLLLTDTPYENKFGKFEIAPYQLTLEEVDDTGATYMVTGRNYNGAIWLCNVTKYVLGNFPEYLCITVFTHR